MNTHTPATTDSTPQPQTASDPPWQVLWKRPRWDRVAFSIGDASDAHSDYLDDCDGCDRGQGYRGGVDVNVGGGVIDEGWIPVSCSSAVLTRREAQVAASELRRRGRLLPRRRGRWRGTCRPRDDDGKRAPSGGSDGKVVDLSTEEPTPKNKNTKIIRRPMSPTPLPRLAPAKPGDVQEKLAGSPPSPPSSKSKSLSSQNSCFKCITSPNKYTITNDGTTPYDKPPRPAGNLQRLTSPSSPTSFSTFNVTTPPPPQPFPNIDDGKNVNEDSTPAMMDASTASSLLWEDMTLTSVSEEDAAAFRLYGTKQHQYRSKGKASMEEEDDDRRKLSYHDQLRNWDGLDNVVLSVTIFATGSKAMGGCASSGDVIVMELLSTNNPSLPFSPNRPPPINSKAAHLGFKMKKRREPCMSTAQIKTSSSSSNSSLTSPSSSMPPPPPQPRSLPEASSAPLRPSTGGGSLGSGDDRPTVSTPRSRYCSLPSSAADEEEEMSNRTRILARRVLWWPSFIFSKRNISGCGDLRCAARRPSLVSLGRTNVWKQRASGGQGEWGMDEEAKQGDEGLQLRGFGGYKGLINDADSVNECGNVDRDDTYGGKQSTSLQTASDEEELTANAVDAFRSLNFLFGGLPVGPLGPTVPKQTEEIAREGSRQNRKGSGASIERPNDKEKILTQPLSMCLVTGSGQVHFYHALRLMLSGTSLLTMGNCEDRNSSAAPGLSDSFAALFLGSELFDSVKNRVMPLSSPLATIQLSQLSASSTTGGGGSRGHQCDAATRGVGDSNPLLWNRFLRRSGIAADDDCNDHPGTLADDECHSPTNNWTSLGGFDASIDPTSLPLRTIQHSNILTGSCITSDPTNGYLATCGKGLRRITKKKGRGRRFCQYSLGGFVTFVSLRHHSEARTVYLPFAPDKIQPVYWMGMHFVALLGEEGPLLSLTPSVALSTTSSQMESRYLGRSVNEESVEMMFTKCCLRPCIKAVRVDCKRQGADINSPLPSADILLDLIGGEHSINLPFHTRNAVGPENLASAFVSSPPAVGAGAGENVASQTPGESTSIIHEHRRMVSYPARFQLMSVNLPPVHESLGSLSELLAPGEDEGQLNRVIQSKAISISSIPSSPPGLVLSFQRRSMVETESCPHLVVVNHTLCYPFQRNSDPRDDSVAFIEKPISLFTAVRPGHRVTLDSGLDDGSLTPTSFVKDRLFQSVWCTGGQGWSLVGIQGTGQKLYFICWDGAASDRQGPFILPLQYDFLSKSPNRPHDMSFCLSTGVTPLMSNVKYAENLTQSVRLVDTELPSSKTYSLPSFLQVDAEGEFHTGFSPKKSFSITWKESIKMAVEIEGGLDDIIVNALESITPHQHQSPESLAKSVVGVGRSSRSKSLTMSHQEKSRCLLRQCSGWTQLDDSEANHGTVHSQVIVATVRLGAQLHSLTLRTNILANPISTPFHQVLSWLCQRRDFYTAASIALSLLDDAEAVYELCGIPKSPEEELTHYKGLLDGIKPCSDGSNGDGAVIMMSLAEMAIGCLIKGGVSMSKSLEGFLARNTIYNAPRACLMLAGATATAISNEQSSQQKMRKIANVVDAIATVESPSEEQIWPVRCLVKMAVVRKCLPSAMLMLNATIPNELRWRASKSKGLACAPRPTLGLFLALVHIILESTEEATRFLLNIMDEESGLSYWFSIAEDTKLVLSLISISGKYVMLQEPEVRVWALSRLKEEIESPADASLEGPYLPDRWLKEIVTGAFCNAGCDIGLGLEAILMASSTSTVVCYRQDMLHIQDHLFAQQQSSDLDFDLLIPALLILICRGQEWRSQISTQTLLNFVCDIAGRKTEVDPKFVFDGATVMRQCALAENLQAASFLVGGKKGLVLECADIVVSNLLMTIEHAEIALFQGALVDLKEIVASTYEGIALQEELVIFVPDVSHHHLTWLLEENVLNVQTYGEFDSSLSTGILTPVFAGRVCFRAWYCLTHPSMLSSSTKWLEGWLRCKLELSNGKSRRRLACAALVRTLLWADEVEELDLSEDNEPLLAIVMGFDGRFMAELSQACCGLIQSIPPHLAEELMSSFGSSNICSFEATFISSAQ